MPLLPVADGPETRHVNVAAMSSNSQSNQVKCKHCGEANPVDAVFCVACGGPVQIKCFQCGAMNLSTTTYCSDCGANLDEYEQASQCLDRVMQFMLKEDHVAAAQEAERGLEHHHSFNKELRTYRQQALEIIEGCRAYIAECFDKARRELIHRQFVVARGQLDIADNTIAREPGAADMAGDAGTIRAEVDRIAEDHRTRLGQADRLKQQGCLRRAASIYTTLVNDFPWDKLLPSRLDEVKVGLTQADQLTDRLENAIANRDFRTALKLCEQVRAIEPDHPQVGDLQTLARSYQHEYDAALRGAEASLKSSQLAQALDELRAVVKRYPTDEKAKTEASMLELRIDAIELYDNARQERYLSRAIHAWQQIIREIPDDAQATVALAKLEPMLEQRRRRRVGRTVAAALIVAVASALIGALTLIRQTNADYRDRARELLANDKSEDAQRELDRMWPIFTADRQQIEDTIKRSRIELILQKSRDAADAARTRAVEAGAVDHAVTLWEWAENFTGEARRATKQKNAADAEQHWLTAELAYDAAEAKAKYELYLASIDPPLLNLLDQSRWRTVQRHVRDAEAGDDNFELITNAYRHAAELLTAAHEKAQGVGDQQS